MGTYATIHMTSSLRKGGYPGVMSISCVTSSVTVFPNLNPTHRQNVDEGESERSGTNIRYPMIPMTAEMTQAIT